MLKMDQDDSYDQIVLPRFTLLYSHLNLHLKFETRLLAHGSGKTVERYLLDRSIEDGIAIHKFPDLYRYVNSIVSHPMPDSIIDNVSTEDATLDDQQVINASRRIS